MNTYLDGLGAFNPAAQGGANLQNVGISYRSQFSNLPKESRPTTFLLSADLSPVLSTISQRIGAGFSLLQDNVRFVKYTGFNAFFAYHLFPPKQGNLSLSFGISAGLNAYQFDFTNKKVNDAFDPTLIQTAENRKSGFNAGPGLQLQYQLSKTSVLQLDAVLNQLFSTNPAWESKGSPSKEIYYDTRPAFTGIVRLRSVQGNGLIFEPVLIYRKTFGEKKNPSGLDGWLRVHFLEGERLTLGLGIRTGSGGILFGSGFVVNESLKLNVSYERHNDVLGNTFEFGARYYLGGGLSKCAGKSLIPKVKDAVGYATRENQFVGDTYKRAELIAVKIEKDLVEAEKTQKYKIQKDLLDHIALLFIEEKPLLNGMRNIWIEEYLKIEQIKNEARSLIEPNGKVFCGEILLDSLKRMVRNIQKLETQITLRLADLDVRRELMTKLEDFNNTVVLQNHFLSDIKRQKQPFFDLILKEVSGTSAEFELSEIKDTNQMKQILAFLKATFRPLKEQGLRVNSVRVSFDIPNSEKMDGKKANMVYQGKAISEIYKLNGKDKADALKSGMKLTNEQSYIVLFESFQDLILKSFEIKSNALVNLELTSGNKEGRVRLLVNF
jgi:type IX secretion system PorP/SprF family membrane protein